MDKLEELKQRTAVLSAAAKAYYVENKEQMSNIEYDRLYDELVALEQETGVVLAQSPTITVGYETVSTLPKEQHSRRMLSLDKTKSVEDLVAFAGNHPCLLSWKLDGLTVVLTYEEGRLQKAVTRGNGEVGEVVTGNARMFSNLPVTIPWKERIVLRGEAIISYSDFERINQELPEIDAKYKNPRNLCSGSVRQLNNEITAERKVRFIAFALVEGEEGSRGAQLEWLAAQGFEVVAYRQVDGETLPEAVNAFAKEVESEDYPSDGLVLTYDDIAYGKSLGETAKFPRDAIAFKWQDERKETLLKEIEWSVSRTGLINPIAVFEPVELEGTTVSRAGVHNVSILKELKLGIGDEIQVYKANMIIPQIAKNITESGNIEIPKVCPVCGGETQLKRENEVETLYCTNPHCPAKKIKRFALFVSRDGMNIEGLSEKAIEKLTSLGFVKEPADLFRLEAHREGIASMEGFGEKAVDNLIAAAQKARHTTPARLLYALGISGIGSANAKLIARAGGGDWNRITALTSEELQEIDGVGVVMATAFVAYFSAEENQKRLEQLMPLLVMEVTKEEEEQKLQGLTFVITGTLHIFEHRDKLKEYIEKRGGKVTGSVSAKTKFL
ncbi:MAG: NAD-dependent DNA ligase LigA, partial [Anaerovoracaceae bacterium]